MCYVLVYLLIRCPHPTKIFRYFFAHILIPQNKYFRQLLFYSSSFLMAALSTFYHPLCAHHNHRTARHSVRSLTVVSCRQQKSPEESGGVIQRTVIRMISEAGKIGKNLKPEKKGDMKDLMLMSLSFAVYVYISQLMVCAYFSWTHVALPNPSW